MSGSAVENLIEQQPAAGPKSKGCVALATTAGGVHTALTGGPYRHVRVWLDSGAAVTYIAVNNVAATTVASDGSFPAIDDGIVYRVSLAGPGATHIHHLAASATGKLNWEAW